MSRYYNFHLLIVLLLQRHPSEEELSSRPGDFSEDAEDSRCCSLKLLVEEEGYEADSESNPEDSEAGDDGKIPLKYLWLDLQVRLSISKVAAVIPFRILYCLAI